jgi:hypothetical protein
MTKGEGSRVEPSAAPGLGGCDQLAARAADEASILGAKSVEPVARTSPSRVSIGLNPGRGHARRLRKIFEEGGLAESLGL